MANKKKKANSSTPPAEAMDAPSSEGNPASVAPEEFPALVAPRSLDAPVAPTEISALVAPLDTLALEAPTDADQAPTDSTMETPKSLFHFNGSPQDSTGSSGSYDGDQLPLEGASPKSLQKSMVDLEITIRDPRQTPPRDPSPVVSSATWAQKADLESLLAQEPPQVLPGMTFHEEYAVMVKQRAHKAEVDRMTEEIQRSTAATRDHARRKYLEDPSEAGSPPPKRSSPYYGNNRGSDRRADGPGRSDSPDMIATIDRRRRQAKAQEQERLAYQVSALMDNLETDLKLWPAPCHKLYGLITEGLQPLVVLPKNIPFFEAFPDGAIGSAQKYLSLNEERQKTMRTNLSHIVVLNEGGKTTPTSQQLIMADVFRSGLTLFHLGLKCTSVPEMLALDLLKYHLAPDEVLREAHYNMEEILESRTSRPYAASLVLEEAQRFIDGHPAIIGTTRSKENRTYSFFASGLFLEHFVKCVTQVFTKIYHRKFAKAFLISRHQAALRAGRSASFFSYLYPQEEATAMQSWISLMPDSYCKGDFYGLALTEVARRLYRADKDRQAARNQQNDHREPPAGMGRGKRPFLPQTSKDDFRFQYKSPLARQPPARSPQTPGTPK